MEQLFQGTRSIRNSDRIIVNEIKKYMNVIESVALRSYLGVATDSGRRRRLHGEVTTTRVRRPTTVGTADRKRPRIHYMTPTKHAAVCPTCVPTEYSDLFDIALATCSALHCWLAEMAGASTDDLFSFQ